METAHRRPHWGSWLLIAIGFAFAWLAMSFILGLGTSEARADDSAGGLLGGVTSTIDNTVRGATNTASAVTTPVVQAVAKTTTDIPVVGPTATHVVTTTTPAVASATQPIANSPTALVTKTAAPVIDAVDSTVSTVLRTANTAIAPLPVIGDVVGTVGVVVGAVTDVVSDPGHSAALPGIPAIPGAPGVPGLSGEGASPTPVSATTPGSDPGAGFLSLGTMLASARQAATVARAAASVVFTLSPAEGALRLARDASPGLGASTPGGTSAGSSGAGPGGAAALLAFGLFFAHRAWVRRTVANDQQAPPVPVYDTDVSPD